MVNPMYPPGRQLNEANDTGPTVLDLHLSFSIGFVSSKSYDKRVDFEFDIVIFLFWDGVVQVLPLIEYTFHNL